DIDLQIIDIIRKYFSISDICDCDWGIYALLANEKLPPLNIPDNVKIAIASSEQKERIKSFDNDEWEFLPKRLNNFRQSDLLILVYANNILAGYLDVVRHYKNYYNIRNIFVHENFRGNNFGSLMTIYYANYCINNGFIPHYGAAMSKYSENVAIKSGFEETTHYHFFGLQKEVTI
ncbi:MAG: GNAT family N-acetyltransferase, partial [Oscillospiraceae bacterium]|nr:GNAT family N-acetyltransferase [Oscillospiraceae bacterium]